MQMLHSVSLTDTAFIFLLQPRERFLAKLRKSPDKNQVDLLLVYLGGKITSRYL